jgi:hypothetical protein
MQDNEDKYKEMYIENIEALLKMVNRINAEAKPIDGQTLHGAKVTKEEITFCVAAVPFLLDNLQNTITALGMAVQVRKDPMLVNLVNILLPVINIMNSDLDFFMADNPAGKKDDKKHFVALKLLAASVRNVIDLFVLNKQDRGSMMTDDAPAKGNIIKIYNN